MSGARNQVSIGALLGASGSGKSSLIKLELLAAGPQRLVIWDPKREYKKFGRPLRKLAELARDAMARRFAVVFEPELGRAAMRKQFNVFCQIAERAGDCFVVVDELADVTEPNWAPEGWERLTRQGRHAGITIRGASQRPADIDKSFYGNASHVAVFRMNAEGDVKRCAALLDVPAATIRTLAPLEWIERDMTNGKLSEKKKLDPRDLARIP